MKRKYTDILKESNSLIRGTVKTDTVVDESVATGVKAMKQAGRSAKNKAVQLLKQRNKKMVQRAAAFEGLTISDMLDEGVVGKVVKGVSRGAKRFVQGSTKDSRAMRKGGNIAGRYMGDPKLGTRIQKQMQRQTQLKRAKVAGVVTGGVTGAYVGNKAGKALEKKIKDKQKAQQQAQAARKK